MLWPLPSNPHRWSSIYSHKGALNPLVSPFHLDIASISMEMPAFSWMPPTWRLYAKVALRLLFHPKSNKISGGLEDFTHEGQLPSHSYIRPANFINDDTHPPLLLNRKETDLTGISIAKLTRAVAMVTPAEGPSSPFLPASKRVNEEKKTPHVKCKPSMLS